MMQLVAGGSWRQGVQQLQHITRRHAAVQAAADVSCSTLAANRQQYRHLGPAAAALSSDQACGATRRCLASSCWSASAAAAYSHQGSAPSLAPAVPPSNPFTVSLLRPHPACPRRCSLMMTCRCGASLVRQRPSPGLMASHMRTSTSSLTSTLTLATMTTR